MLMCWIAFLILAATSGTVQAATYYVDPDHRSTYSPQFTTIAAAMYAAAPGDDVWVVGPLYSEDIALKSGVRVFGGFTGSEQSINDRQAGWYTQTSGAAYFSNVTTATLDGFIVDHATMINDAENRITNCVVYGTGGLMLTSSVHPAISNSIIMRSQISGINSHSSSPSIDRCRIVANMSTFGGGVYCSNSNVTITNCEIADNYAHQTYIYPMAGGYGGGVYSENDSTVTLINCNLIANRADGGGKSIYQTGNYPTLALNCIFRGIDPNDSISGAVQTQSCLTYSYNSINGLMMLDMQAVGRWTGYSTTDDNGTWLYDSNTTFTTAMIGQQIIPRFSGTPYTESGCNTIIGIENPHKILVSGLVFGTISAGMPYKILDTRLFSMHSAAVDAGTTISAVTDDLTGNQRPIDLHGTGHTCDIGAYELQAPQPGWISCSSSDLYYDCVQIGDGPTAAQTVTILNLGDLSLTLSAVELDPAISDSDQFIIVGDTGETSLAMGQSRTVQVAYRPTRAGGSSGSLRIAHDDPNHPTKSVGLFGYCIDVVWVDFAYMGMEKNGSFEMPFNLLADGVTAADPTEPNAIVKIKSGSSAESLRINKTVRLEAIGGLVRIGR